LRKIKIKTTSGFKSLKKRLKKIDLTKEEEEMSVSIEKTLNKIDFSV